MFNTLIDSSCGGANCSLGAFESRTVNTQYVYLWSQSFGSILGSLQLRSLTYA